MTEMYFHVSFQVTHLEEDGLYAFFFSKRLFTFQWRSPASLYFGLAKVNDLCLVGNQCYSHVKTI